MSLAEGEEVAVGTVLIVSTLAEGAVGGVFLVWGEYLCDLLGEQVVVELAVLCLVVGDLLFLASVCRSKFDDA